MEMQFLFCEVGIEFFYVIYINFGLQKIKATPETYVLNHVRK
jgi:hypothetical protein